jgi:peptide/nickel transport system permease protein
VAGLVVRRLLALIPTMLIVSFAVFGLVTLVPGDAAAYLAGGDSASPEKVIQVREQLGLDDPFLTQYGRWLKSAATGDLGKSLNSGEPVTSEIRKLFPVTASIVLVALVFGLLIGLPAGLLAGVRPGGKLDRSLMAGTTFGIAVPNFWLAMILITYFAVHWHIFPAIGFTRFGESPFEWLKSVTLPALALSVGLAASLARQVRAALSDVMGSSYIRTAWATGGSVPRVIGKHALKNAAIPALTVLGLQLGGLLGGAVIIEQIFAVPGIGLHVLRAIRTFDLPVIQGVALMFVVINMTLSLLIDVAYGYLNPKVRVA